MSSFCLVKNLTDNILSLMKNIISFASDFGISDGSVGVVKGVINRIDPDLKINDISHNIPPQNIKYGSLLLMRAIQYIPPGVLLAVVDPGVGTERKPVAIQTEWGIMVGPDNGLLNLACATVGGAQKAHLLENEDWIIPSEGNTFHARDIFSPFAAGLASSQLSIEECGEEVDLMNLQQYLIPLTEKKENEVKGEVMWIDHYGNCQTNISPEELSDLDKNIGDVISLNINNQEIKTTWVNNYQEEGVNQLGIVTDSWGMISIFSRNKNAGEILDIQDGEKVTIKK
jgi:S-adenosylmethionine hydrolase